MKTLHVRHAVVALSAAFAAQVVAAAPASYKVTALGTATSVIAINKNGLIAGNSLFPDSNGAPMAALYRHGTWHELAGYVAFGINQVGDVVGVGPVSGKPMALIWARGGDAIVIPAPADAVDIHPRAINTQRTVAGSASTPFTTRCWLVKGTAQVEIDMPGSPYCEASAINDAEQVVINFGDVSHGMQSTAIWDAASSVITPVGSFGGPRTYGAAINRKGHVAVTADVAAGSDGIVHRHAAIWRGQKLVDLGTLGGTDSDVAAINDKDEVVGTFKDTNGSHGFLYTAGMMVPLEPMLSSDGSLHLSPTGINNLGVIIGYGNGGQPIEATPVVK